MTQQSDEEETLPLTELDDSQGYLPVVADENDTMERSSGASPIRSTAWRLYISHFLSTWNSRVFEFGAVLYLASIFPDTLMPMSVYAVARAGAAIAFSPAVGRYIDYHDRLRVVRLSIITQRVAVLISCVALLVLMIVDSAPAYVRYLTLTALSALACVEKLGSVMNLVAVEKDWVIEVAAGDVQQLANLNARMRRIDLLCKLIGPLLIALIDGVGTKAAIIVNIAMNVASLPVEYFAIAEVYKRCEALRRTKTSRAEAVSQSSLPRSLRSNCATLFQQSRDYFTHTACLPSFALSLLYFTVLSFAGQMVAYLIFAGYTSLYVGLARVAAVMFEMSATWAAPMVMDRIGPVRSGAWFATWQTLTLTAGVAFFFEAVPPELAASGLVVGTILSRVGLRGFELAAQIIVQDEVEADMRGSFSAIEASWQNFFELCAFASTIVFAKPDQFRWPVLMSLAATAIASVTYAWFVRRRRGHLVHLSECIDLKKRSRKHNTDGRAGDYELLNAQSLEVPQP